MCTTVESVRFERYHARMKIIFISLLTFAAMLLPATASAYYSSSYGLGNTVYSNYDDGGYSSSYSLGNTNYYSNSDGMYGSSYDLGNSTYYNYSYPSHSSYGSGSLSGSSYKLGDSTYYNLYDSEGGSVSGSSYRLGNTEYYSIGENSYSCYWLGSTRYCN